MLTLNYTLVLVDVDWLRRVASQQTVPTDLTPPASPIITSRVARALLINIKKSYLYYLIEERMRVGNTSIKVTIFMTMIYG